MLTSALRTLFNNPVKKSFYKKKINILTNFFIFYKNNIKILLLTNTLMILVSVTLKQIPTFLFYVNF